MVRPRSFTDAELLAGARECFLEHGPGVSTSHIAAEIGVSQATLFKRFGSKDGLMKAALMPRAEGEHWEALKTPVDERPVPEQLIERGKMLMRFFQKMVPCIAVLRAHSGDMLRELADSESAPPVRALRATQGFFDACIEQGRMRPCNTEALALLWLGGLRNRAFWSHMLPGTTVVECDDYVRAITETLWAGIAPLEAA
jgi:AcrR family transcriptional regulator